MRLRDFFILIGAGLALHQTASITHRMPVGWEQLAGTAIGVEGTFPLFVLMMKRLGLDEETRMRASAAYQLAFLCVGIGVAIGWLVDTMFGVDRQA